MQFDDSINRQIAVAGPARISSSLGASADFPTSCAASAVPTAKLPSGTGKDRRGWAGCTTKMVILDDRKALLYAVGTNPDAVGTKPDAIQM